MPRKNKPRNPLTFCVNTDPGVICREMRKAEKERKTRRYTLFIFRISRISQVHSQP